MRPSIVACRVFLSFLALELSLSSLYIIFSSLCMLLPFFCFLSVAIWTFLRGQLTNKKISKPSISIFIKNGNICTPTCTMLNTFPNYSYIYTWHLGKEKDQRTSNARRHFSLAPVRPEYFMCHIFCLENFFSVFLFLFQQTMIEISPSLKKCFQKLIELHFSKTHKLGRNNVSKLCR